MLYVVQYHMNGLGFCLDDTGGNQPHLKMIQGSIEALDLISPYKKTSNVPWDRVENAEWCQAQFEDPLPYYENCRWDSFVFQFGVHGGLTNALYLFPRVSSEHSEIQDKFYWSHVADHCHLTQTLNT